MCLFNKFVELFLRGIDACVICVLFNDDRFCVCVCVCDCFNIIKYNGCDIENIEVSEITNFWSKKD